MPDFRILMQFLLFYADEDVISELHRFRPAFLAANRLHIYHEPSAFKHTCTLQSELLHGMNGLKLDEENLDSVDNRGCLAAPYVNSSDFHAIAVFEKLKSVIKEVVFRLFHFCRLSIFCHRLQAYYGLHASFYIMFTYNFVFYYFLSVTDAVYKRNYFEQW